jgi:hypothetical protein
MTEALAPLKESKFRSRFKLAEKDRLYIQTKGIDSIRAHAIDFITARLASAFPKNDGKQIPIKVHRVFIA